MHQNRYQKSKQPEDLGSDIREKKIDKRTEVLIKSTIHSSQSHFHLHSINNLHITVNISTVSLQKSNYCSAGRP